MKSFSSAMSHVQRSFRAALRAQLGRECLMNFGMRGSKLWNRLYLAGGWAAARIQLAALACRCRCPLEHSNARRLLPESQLARLGGRSERTVRCSPSRSPQ